MTFEDVVALRDDALKVVAQRIPEGRVLEYEIAGGQESAHPWEAAGFFSEVVGQGRLVFEALFFAARGMCVLRVYRESSSEVLSTAVMEQIEPEEGLAAGDVFVSSLRTQDLVDVAAERQQLRESDLPDLVERVLYPLPPPIPAGTFQRRVH